MNKEYVLSVLIPSRNEMFLGETIKNILKNIEGDTEIIAVLDGYTEPIPDIPKDDRVRILKYKESIGQRAATNEACKLSKAKYVMKTDAHCSFDKGFDVKMINEMHDDWTMIPIMYNLHAFDWVCKNGHRRYQGPSGKCEECGEETKKDILWKEKRNPESTAYRFDNTLHFQYWRDYKKKQKGDLVETMSIQGSCFMLTREKYWELNICDEKHGSWGQQGVEVACKTWLSGGRVIVNKKTWYAHMFRTQGGDFGFPYPNPGVKKAREYSRDLWINNKWDKAIRPFSWLIEKFNPPDWSNSKGILYYTDNELDPKIMKFCQEQIKVGAKQNRIVSVSLKKIGFGDNITLDKNRGYETMAKQILAGLKALDTDIVFFCEHDVLYHHSHFEFIPPEKDVFYYNDNVWFLRLKDGHTLHYNANQLSGLCAYREPLIKHYEERVALIEKEGFSRKIGFEPMTHNRIKWKNKYGYESWKSREPNVDIKHATNLTSARWSKDQFRNKKFTEGWKEGENWKISGWNDLDKLIK